MTDKEMAKKYRESLKQRLVDEDEFERLGMFDENVEEAWLAGFEAGKPQWHYLQENPSDLPKNREKVLLLVELNDKWNRTELLVGYRDFGDCLGEYCKDWGYFDPVKNIYYDFVDGEEVIAWKEIALPELKESE